MRVSSSSSSSTFLRSVVLGDDILGVRQKRLKSERECRRRVVHSKFLYYLYSFCSRVLKSPLFSSSLDFTSILRVLFFSSHYYFYPHFYPLIFTP